MQQILFCICFFGMFASSLAQEANISIYVNTKSSAVVESMQVFIAGNNSKLGNWNPSAVRFKKENDTLWSFSEKFDRKTVLEFKITLGSWESEAIFKTGELPNNIYVDVSSDTSIILHPITWKNKVQLQNPKNEITGKVEYHIQMYGRGLRYAHDIIVWLPPSYETSKQKRFPVLYMHDGQNLFNPATAFGGNDWRMDEVADSLIHAKKLEEIIIVGINNSPDRLPEYSDSDLGHSYANFVVNVVKPFIDSTYRTKSDKKNTAVMGSSMGGLISLLIAWWYPDVFSMAGCLSSSFWYDDEKTLKDIQNYTGVKKKIRIYLDCGTRERELISGYKKMVSALRKKGYTKKYDLEYQLEPNGVHNEVAWAARVWRPLLFMYKKK